MIVGLLLMLPTSISVLGFSGSCGPPAIAVLDSGSGEDAITRGLIEQCQAQSMARIVAAAALGVIGAAAGALMLANGARKPQPQGWYPYGLYPPHRAAGYGWGQYSQPEPPTRPGGPW
jgi:hypothetical protein